MKSIKKLRKGKTSRSTNIYSFNATMARDQPDKNSERGSQKG